MVRSNIGRYILFVIVSISLVTLLTMSWAASLERRSTIRAERLKRLQTVVRLVKASILEEEGTGLLELEKLQRLTRRFAAEASVYLTVIDEDGKVLADTLHSPRRMENLGELIEFQKANEETFGYGERYVASKDETMLMVAKRVVHDGVAIAYVRAGIGQPEIESGMGYSPLIFGGIAMLVFVVALLVTRSIEEKAINSMEDLILACDQLAENRYSQILRSSSRNELGRLVRGFQDMAIAVTNREADLRDQANRIETVLGSMVEGVIAVNSDRVVLLANDAVLRLLAIRVQQVEGRPLIEVTRIRALDQAVQQALTKNEPVSTEFEVSHSNYRRVLSMQANRLPGTPCPGVVMVLHDMSELRPLENLRREFIANVSHELKTPLAAIRAYAETLQLGGVDDAENRDHFLRQITDQSDRLHDLIMDMLQLARVEAGQEVFDIVDVRLADVVRSCVETSRDTAATKDIQLVVEASDQEVTVVADEEGVRTILGNLIDNAVKYSGRPGDVVISWSVSEKYVEITVRDFGIGIPADAQDRIFERFYRVDKARSREMGGTGLGLSIVKHLAGSFGGNVSLASRPNEGSTFTVRLKKGGILTN